MPITWQNVNTRGDAPALAASPLAAAGTSINTAFDGLSKILAQRNAFNEQQAAQGQDNVKQAFLDKLAAAKTPEELAALQQSGALQDLQSHMGAQARAAVRGADEARLNSVRQNVTAAENYEQQQWTHDEKPLHDQIAALALTDPIKAAALRAEHPELHDQAALAAAVNAGTDRARMLNMQKVTDANTILSAEEQKRQVDERKATDDLVTTGTQSFAQQQAARKTAIQSLAAANKIPLGDDGMPDTDKLTPAQLESFNKTLADKGLNQGPSASSAADQIKQAGLKLGLPARVVEAAAQQASQVIQEQGAIGPEDKERLGQVQAALALKRQQTVASNPFYTLPSERAAQQKSVLDTVETAIKDGPMTKTAIRQRLSDWMNKGMTFTDKDGKSVTVAIPPKVIAAAFSANLESDTWLHNDTDNKMENTIVQFMTDPQYEQARQDAEYIMNNGDTRDALRMRDKLRSRAGTVTATDWMDSFKSRLDTALEAAKNAKTGNPALNAPITGLKVSKPVPKTAAEINQDTDLFMRSMM